MTSMSGAYGNAACTCARTRCAPSCTAASSIFSIATSFARACICAPGSAVAGVCAAACPLQASAIAPAISPAFTPPTKVLLRICIVTVGSMSRARRRRHAPEIIHHFVLPLHLLPGDPFELTKVLLDPHQIGAALVLQIAHRLRQPEREFLPLTFLALGHNGANLRRQLGRAGRRGTRRW